MHGWCAWPRLRSLLNTIFRSEAYYWPESINEQEHIAFAAEVLLCISYALGMMNQLLVNWLLGCITSFFR
jgi:hypothetical protein